MKNIGVITNREKDKGLKYTKILAKHIKDEGGNAILPSNTAVELGMTTKYPDEESVLDNSDIAICLGGDGTFLDVARKVYKKDTPILGINLGTLGFLTEVDKNDIHNAVKLVLHGKYEIENRMMLEATIKRNEDIIARDIALNDVVISRGALSRILHLKTYINNVFTDMFPGDGLIISSPTGSTAYSLSAGGPIVEPDTHLIIMTPICPHTLYSRTIVTTGDRVVNVLVDEKDYSHKAMITIDGKKGYEVSGGDSVEIKKSTYFVKLVKISSGNFFNVLRTKIYSRGEGLRKNEI